MTGIPEQRAARTQLHQIIAGITDGIIVINPDQTIDWANKAALTLHGVENLEDLGGTVSEYRSRFELRYRNQHRLPSGDYPMERLLSGQASSEVIVEVARPGHDRHWYHRIRSLVLTDPEGEPDLLVLVLNDETDRFNAEERFEKMFGANPAPAIITRLADMRYVRVNRGFLEMTGYARDALIGRSMHEIDVLKSAERRDLAVERLHAGETIPQMEGCLGLPDGSEKTVLLAGQPITVGEEPCMLFTFADLHPRKQAETALRQSEERFAQAFQMAPGPMAIIALDGMRVLDVNDAFTKATGWQREELVGRSGADLELWGHGEARERLEREMRQTGTLRSADIQLRSRDGRTGDYLVSAETVTIGDQRCVLSVMLDITERRQSEMALLSAIDEVMKDTSWLGQKIVEKLASISVPANARAATPELDTLSSRARAVLGYMAEGLSDADIATKLGITRNTVRNHVSGIFGKLGMNRRSAVIVWARERGLGTNVKPLLKRVK